MISLDNSWTGTRTTAGVVTFRQSGLPGDLAARLPGSERISTINFSQKTFHVDFATTGNLRIEACEGDPFVAADWYEVTAITADGAYADNNVRKFVRARLETPGTGVTVRVTAKE